MHQRTINERPNVKEPAPTSTRDNRAYRTVVLSVAKMKRSKGGAT